MRFRLNHFVFHIKCKKKCNLAFTGLPEVYEIFIPLMAIWTGRRFHIDLPYGFVDSFVVYCDRACDEFLSHFWLANSVAVFVVLPFASDRFAAAFVDRAIKCRQGRNGVMVIVFITPTYDKNI